MELIEEVGWLVVIACGLGFLLPLGVAIYLFPRNPRLYPRKLFLSLLIFFIGAVVSVTTLYLAAAGLRPFDVVRGL